MNRRRLFIAAYIANFGWPTRAARIAGCPERGVRVAAYRLMRDPDVRAVIDAEWQAQREQWERESRDDELERELIWRWELAGRRARLFG